MVVVVLPVTEEEKKNEEEEEEGLEGAWWQGRVRCRSGEGGRSGETHGAGVLECADRW